MLSLLLPTRREESASAHRLNICSHLPFCSCCFWEWGVFQTKGLFPIQRQAIKWSHYLSREQHHSSEQAMTTKLNLVRFFKLISKINNFWQIITIFSSFRLLFPFTPMSSPLSPLHLVVGFIRIQIATACCFASRGNGNTYTKRDVGGRWAGSEVARSGVELFLVTIPQDEAWNVSNSICCEICRGKWETGAGSGGEFIKYDIFSILIYATWIITLE